MIKNYRGGGRCNRCKAKEFVKKTRKGPSTIPPEHYYINQYITRGKYTKTTVVPENGSPPSELKLARRIGSAPQQLDYKINAQCSGIIHFSSFIKKKFPRKCECEGTLFYSLTRSLIL